MGCMRSRFVTSKRPVRATVGRARQPGGARTDFYERTNGERGSAARTGRFEATSRKKAGRQAAGISHERLNFVSQKEFMTALQQIERLLPTISKGEKAQIARWIESDLNHHTPGIEKTPGVCGGSACIVRTRIPVWLLVEARDAGDTEAHLMSSFPTLRAEDLINAWAYYRANKAEIDAEIADNENA